jgi:hypothetical protein
MSLPLARVVSIRYPFGSGQRRRKIVRTLWNAVAISFAITVGLAGLADLRGYSSRVTHCYDSKSDITRLQVNEYADSAYVLWARANPGRRCPDALGDLNEFTNRKGVRAGRPDITDSWGNPMLMLCGEKLLPGADGIAVTSAGEDGRLGTPDDIRSWE